MSLLLEPLLLGPLLLGPLLLGLSIASLGIWLGMVLIWGGFWRARPRIEEVATTEPASWPRVVALVPARNEAGLIARTVTALRSQAYPGDASILIIDDHSEDGTAAEARAAAGNHAVEVIGAEPLPRGWSGKLWALDCGVRRALAAEPDYLWFNDADIETDPDTLARLVSLAEARGADMVSVMARLDAGDAWGRLLIAPFVYFFQKLYPFAWVNRPGMPIAAAAGGCVLIRRDALGAIGGLASLRHALIDDVTLAHRVKFRMNGRGIWLGLSAGSVRSLRPYGGLSGVWHMVARTAFTQLRYSTALLLLTLLGMALVYLTPPVGLAAGLAVGNWTAALAAGTAWALMAGSYWPTLRAYGGRPAEAALLPIAAVLYTAMTVDSARRSWLGIGGAWKGRVAAEADRAAVVRQPGGGD